MLFLHSLREAYKQMGNVSFTFVILTPMFLFFAGVFSIAGDKAQINSIQVNHIFLICAAITFIFAFIAYLLFYFHLYKIKIKDLKTGECKIVRTSDRYPKEIMFDKFTPHCDSGPAVTGYSGETGDKWVSYYFEGEPIDEEVFERISNAKEKSNLVEFMTSGDSVVRKFAKFKTERLTSN